MSTHGLPEELDQLLGKARLRRNLDQQIERGVQKALAAGYSVARINEILTTHDYPPPGADKKWVAGWEAAKANAEPPDNDYETHAGYHAFLYRSSRP